MFLPLKDQARFQQARGDYALIWLNPETGAYDEKAIDIAPECIRFFCEKYGKTVKGHNGGRIIPKSKERPDLTSEAQHR